MSTQAEKCIAFIETFCTLTDSFSGEPFILLPWQRKAIRLMFDEGPGGRRKLRVFILSIARKNGKSALGAAIALYMLVADRSEAEPLIISAAGDRAQAKLVFTMAKKMVEASPELSAVCKVFSNEIQCTLNNGVYKVISADAGRAHGLNPSCVLADELHVWPKDDLYVALNSGSAARREPLTIVMSTPGYELDSPFGRLVQYGRKILSGEVDDPTYALMEFGPEKELSMEEYADEALWERCNPSWAFINADEMRSNFKQMHINDFVRYRLGGWVQSKEAWLPPGSWDALTKTDSIRPGEKIVLGLDAAWKGDCTALVACRIEDMHLEVVGLWENVDDDPEWRTPQAELRQTILNAVDYFNVVELAADPWRAEILLQELDHMGINVVEFQSNSMARMGPATAGFYTSVMDKTLSHDGNPALSRHIGNAILKESGGYARISKENKASKKHIDLAVAAIIAHHRAGMYLEKPVGSPEIIIL